MSKNALCRLHSYINVDSIGKHNQLSEEVKSIKYPSYIQEDLSFISSLDYYVIFYMYSKLFVCPANQTLTDDSYQSENDVVIYFLGGV